MSESCGGNCSSCSEACSERKPESLQAQPNPKSKIGKVIAVVSGKGGVGKSTVSAMLATAMQRTCRYHRPVHPEGLRRQRMRQCG